jgi:arsenite methyltransferase
MCSLLRYRSPSGKSEWFWLAVVVLFAVMASAGSDSAQERNPVPEALRYLEEPGRDRWQMPERVIRALGLQKSDVVADVGAGTGYFSRRFAKDVAQVYAEDIDPEALDFLRKAVIPNMTVISGKAENPLLPTNSCNLVFICDVLHLVRNRPAFLRTIFPAVKPTGEVAVIDFYKRETPIGPPLSMKLSEQEVTKDFLKAGFTLNKQLNFLPYQYFLIFSPKRPSF